MSFLLDVADPSIHFHARQSNTSTPSKGCPSLSKPTTSPVETDPPKPTLDSTSATNSPSIAPQASLSVPVPQSIFSTMSRMIRTASGASIGSGPGQFNSAHFSSSPPSLASSASSTATTTPIATPSEFLEKPRSQPSHSGFCSASTSPWLIPNVCDDEQMNKLVSFQL